MCGIVGIIGTPNAAKESYLGLLMLQHRGQDSAGILSLDLKSNEFHIEKNLGHVKIAINEESLLDVAGDEISIGHTRYSTIGRIRKEDIQPMFMSYPYGIGMVHNGNLVNTQSIKEKLLSENQRYTLSQNDLEVMMNLMAQGLSENISDNDFEKILSSIQKIFATSVGGYAVLSILANHGLIAFKDPNALRPLVWGRRKLTEEELKFSTSKTGFAYAVASESNALNFLGYEDIVELVPGEILYISKEGKIFNKILSENIARPCMFEWIYFANADSTIWNKNVYQMRLKFGEIIGERLAQENLDIDIVVPVPDTARPSAITISEALQKPYREVLIKNRYTQRTFILNKQDDRDKMVKLKLNVVAAEVKDKNVLLVDDSIVRGTTSSRIIKLLKDNGARSVYIASTCPPIIKPCFFGIDFPNSEELIAYNKTAAEIANSINADGVFFLRIEELRLAFHEVNTCRACVDGEYPINIQEANTMIKTRISHEKTTVPGFC